MNLSSSQSLYSGIRASKFWIAEFVKLKELILQKYYRFIINTAQSDFKSLGHTVSLDDMAQNYVLVSSKALDKCDYEQGTLTSYLQLWLKSAKHKITKKGSISNTVSSFISDGTSSESNYVRLDDASLLDKDELVQEERIDDHITHVRLLLKEMDPTGIIRLSMGIEEILNKEELAILETSC